MQAVVRRMLDEDAPTSEIIIDVPPGEAKNTVCLIFTARHERAERDAS